MQATRRTKRWRWLSLALPLLFGCQSLRPASVLRSQTRADEILAAGAVVFLPPKTLSEKVIPVSLDSVLRLAQDRNGQVQLARAKVQEAYADQALARKAWLPTLFVGPSYSRHEGGIQDFQGNRVHSSYGSFFAGLELRGRFDPRDVVFQRVEAERKLWQQKGELSKLTSENLLDAANTYVDLLAARASEAIAADSEKQLSDLAEQTRGLTKVDPGSTVELTRVEAELRGHRLQTRKLREGASAAMAKLAYLLGLDPTSTLVPVEPALAPFTLVDASQPVEALIEEAHAAGPGVRELEGLLALIEETRSKADGAGRFLPALEVSALEGAFGAGPGSRLSFDNRFDLGLHLRWNLTEYLTARERRQQGDAKTLQAHLSYQDLRARLSLGVQEAREAVLSGQDQVALAEEQIRHADESFQLSLSRFQQSIKGRSPSEVLLSSRSLGGARLIYLQSIRELNKAQLRLFILTGTACSEPR